MFGGGGYKVELRLPLSRKTTAASVYAHLTLLCKRAVKIKGLQDATLTIGYKDGAKDESVQPFLSGLPQMAGMKKCDFSYLGRGDLALLLKAFPDVTSLRLSPQGSMDDADLQVVFQACSKLKRLCLSKCALVSPEGVLELCQRLPSLQAVVFCGFAMMDGSAVKKCEQLLESHCPLVRLEVKAY